MAQIDQIVGWPTSDKVPGFYGQTKFGVGRTSVGEWPIVIALTGTKTSDGSMTPDSDVEQVFSFDQAIAKVGKRSTAAQQAKAAFSVPGANIVLAPPAEASGAASATITITIAGTWTTSGTIPFWVNGERAAVDVGGAMSPTEAATAGVLAFGENQTLPVTAANVAGVITLTVASKGTQGNQYLLGWDMSEAPAGLTVTVVGGTPKHAKLVPFSGGTGTESLTNLIDVLEAGQYDFIAAAQNDATNAGLLRTHVESECVSTISHLEHVIFGHNGTLATASSFASSTLNSERCATVWMENGETHPAAMAANAAAYRSSVVGENPNHVYAGKALKAIAPHRYEVDKPGHATQAAALNSGLTPLLFSDGYVRIIRDCVTKCLVGATPSYKTYGWPHADVPDRMRKEAGALIMARREGNPYCGPDTVAGEATAGEGVETPSTLKTALTVLWKEKETANWLQDVDSNPITVVYDTTRKCLVFSAPVVVRNQNLQTGGSINQTAA
jgi:phage tail sheath gpL-like